MLLSLINKETLKDIKEIGFKSEKEMQTLVEKNMDLILGIKFITSEFTVSDLRIDSVAYDEVTNAFIIIEYKNNKNLSVIDQGYTYLSTMFNHKADFVLEYNRITGKMLGIGDIEWSQSRIVFISPSYTKYQINSINFKDLPISLWKIKKYMNDIILFEELKPAGTMAKIKEVAPKIEKEIVGQSKDITKVYTEEELLLNASEEIIDLYSELKEFILDLDDTIKTKVTKLYMAFLYKNRNLFSIKIQKNSLIMWLYSNIDEIDDPEKIVEDVSEKGHHGCGNCQIKIYDKKYYGHIQDILRRNFDSKK